MTITDIKISKNNHVARDARISHYCREVKARAFPPYIFFNTVVHLATTLSYSLVKALLLRPVYILV